MMTTGSHNSSSPGDSAKALAPQSHPSDRPRLRDTKISVVLPVYNEQAALDTLVELLERALEPVGCRFELLFVNDGSSDGSGAKLDGLAARKPHVRALHLSRNFGHQPAVQAGLMHADGDAVILMDSDLQDDPASLPDLIARWQEGYEVVYAVRYGRKEGPLKRLAFYSFYRLLNLISNTPIPMDAGNFSLLDRRVAAHIALLADYDRYFPGLRSWVGYRQVGVPVERLARHDEKPRVSLRQLFALAKTAIFAFSRTPLSLFYVISLVALLACLSCTAWTLYHKLITGRAIPGWTSLAILVSLFGAVNALGISVLGEYVVRIYDQVRGRPQFIVARKVNFDRDLSRGDDLESVWREVQQLREQLAAATDHGSDTLPESFPTSSLSAAPDAAFTADSLPGH